jgi:hypothetical protein
MISRNLWNRLKRLEDKIKPRGEPQATPQQLQAIQMIHEARRRIALEEGKPYVEYRRPDWLAAIVCPPGADPTITILHAWRKRIYEESTRLEQEAATDASERNI